MRFFRDPVGLFREHFAAISTQSLVLQRRHKWQLNSRTKPLMAGSCRLNDAANKAAHQG